LVVGGRVVHDARVTPSDTSDLLAAASVDEAVLGLRADYRALLVVVDGITPAEGDASSEELLDLAEEHAQALLAQSLVEELPHVAAWRAAYRAFGAKPQRTRNSLEALTRRAPDGLPRVNRLTDVYNAVSVLHQVPVGGEDLDRYAGPPRLARAVGDERFDTVAGGEPVVEHPEPGEVVWRDDAGVTCRRWNWRQARRTQLTDATTTALFILDALEPMPTEALQAAADDLVRHLSVDGTPLRSRRRLLGHS
jgi:DNA/RNA-binding domain of Phe-tRNA-synthetase-like protein